MTILHGLPAPKCHHHQEHLLSMRFLVYEAVYLSNKKEKKPRITLLVDKEETLSGAANFPTSLSQSPRHHRRSPPVKLAQAPRKVEAGRFAGSRVALGPAARRRAGDGCFGGRRPWHSGRAATAVRARFGPARVLQRLWHSEVRARRLGGGGSGSCWSSSL